jgi:nucleoside-diphosphate-sugar epimerase
VADESAPLYRDPPPSTRDAVESMRVLEDATLNTPGIEGVVLRYGFFYGAGQFSPDGAMAEDLRRRRLPIVGSGEGRFSFVHVDDAAAATVLALAHGAPGIYNVTDDEPVPQREWVPRLARILETRPPRHVPLWLAKLVAGPMALGAVSLRGADNAKARHELSWTPARATWREGFAEVFG